MPLVAKLAKDRALARIWEADATFFTSDASHERSIKSRLGWLRAPALMQSKRAELEAFAADVKAGGYTDVVLLGMGGSSLWPEVVSVVWRDGRRAGAARPRQHRSGGRRGGRGPDRGTGRRCSSSPRSRAARSRSRRSSGTSGRRRWRAAATTSRSAGANFVAITDPATRLGQLAEEKHYRRVFINPADIGGRYSALSYFGMVPAALVGTDIGALIGAGVEFAAASGAAVPVAESPGVVLGAAIGAAHAAGRDKLTLVISPDIASFGSWIEQLVAESSGKEGKGIVPIDLEPRRRPRELRRRSLLRLHAVRGGRRAAGRGRDGARARRAARRAHRRRSARGAGARDLPLGDGDRDRLRQHGREPVRRAQRDRGEGRDQRPPRPARRRGQAARRDRRHLRGGRRRPDPRAPGDGDAGRLRRVLRLLPAHARARRSCSPACASPAATARTTRRPSGTARASCTRPASCTRAARTRACSCS